ncbi:hypothetical protein LR48_Vigan08g047100 [Vigna angularis]|uniref:Uncharacterized protein n=1 Tax=Phaseolus angularis TaxID=3914 RepID=A0A0L9V4K9_PHAAN|nr:hypothetical protein LR48_Vigan08g047100 [Vigna angularis]
MPSIFRPPISGDAALSSPRQISPSVSCRHDEPTTTYIFFIATNRKTYSRRHHHEPPLRFVPPKSQPFTVAPRFATTISTKPSHCETCRKLQQDHLATTESRVIHRLSRTTSKPTSLIVAINEILPTAGVGKGSQNTCTIVGAGCTRCSSSSISVRGVAWNCLFLIRVTFLFSYLAHSGSTNFYKASGNTCSPALYCLPPEKPEQIYVPQRNAAWNQRRSLTLAAIFFIFYAMLIHFS